MTKALPLLILPLSFLACAAPAAEDDAPEPVTEQTTQALVSPEYESIDDDVNLWYSSLAFCYLTSVSGDLLPRTGDDFEVARGVGLGVRDGMWHLYASGASARARCAQWSDFKYAGTEKLVSSPDGWQTQQSWYGPRPLWSSNALCFLGGAGQGFGGSEGVSVGREASTWTLAVKGYAAPRGSAMCIDTRRTSQWRSTNYAWSQGNPQTWMMKSSEGVCMLTGMSGKFAGGGERVEIVEDSGYWVLRGSSMQYGVQATAQCVPYSQLVIPSGFKLSLGG